MIKKSFFLIIFILKTTAVFSAMIDGPAYVFTKIRGKRAGMLLNGTYAEIISRKGYWIKMRVPVTRKTFNRIKNSKNKRYINQPVLNRIGFIYKGFKVKTYYLKSKNAYFFNIYSVLQNVKQRVLYFRDYSYNIHNHNKIKLTFNRRISGRKYRNVFYGNIKNTNTFVRVGYKRNKRSVIQKITNDLSHGMNNGVILFDEIMLDKNNRITRYDLGGSTLLKTGKFHYTKTGSFYFMKKYFSTTAPLSYRAKLGFVIFQNKLKREVIFSVKSKFSSNGTRIKKYFSKTVMKVKKNNKTIENKTKKFSSSAAANQVLKYFINSKIYKKINKIKYGINFKKIFMEFLKFVNI